jgi:hypothetical protein
MRLRGFVDMIETEAYVTYQARPYMSEEIGTTILPRISTNQDGSILERPDHDLDKIKNTHNDTSMPISSSTGEMLT